MAYLLQLKYHWILPAYFPNFQSDVAFLILLQHFLYKVCPLQTAYIVSANFLCAFCYSCASKGASFIKHIWMATTGHQHISFVVSASTFNASFSQCIIVYPMKKFQLPSCVFSFLDVNIFFRCFEVVLVDTLQVKKSYIASASLPCLRFKIR